MVIAKLWQDLLKYFRLFYQIKFRGYKTDILGKGLRGLGLVFMSLGIVTDKFARRCLLQISGEKINQKA